MPDPHRILRRWRRERPHDGPLHRDLLVLVDEVEQLREAMAFVHLRAESGSGYPERLIGTRLCTKVHARPVEALEAIEAMARQALGDRHA